MAYATCVAKPLRQRTVPSVLLSCDASALLGKRPKGDRKAQLVAGCNGVLPIPPGRAGEQIGGSRLNLEPCTPESGRSALPESEARRSCERDADDLVEDIAIAVPSDAGARVVAGKQDMDEIARFHAAEGRGLLAQRL